ncbi:hypothetical protein [Flavobacterium sp. J27]|uniref:hypothetical protein n=1 Tax=Flavobacterium sp. J27 TaxID=2060419 RepID=UPI00103001AF|nr:hypothetical protein [Flavobacterium sp. J27]
MTKKLLFILSVLILISCGKSKEELELEKAKIDLEKTKLELLKEKKEHENNEKKNELNKIHEQKLQVGLNKRRQKLNEYLDNAKNELKKAKEHLNSVNSFKLGRLKSTKEKQVFEASKKIYDIEKSIDGLENALSELELRQTFAFQDNPKSLIEYLFKSFKNKDFKNIKFLVDPYAENSNKVEYIYLLKYFPGTEQDKFLNEVSNCRVMGAPIIDNDKAAIEFAYGESSNKLAKMTFIKRMDKWYIFGNE